MLGDRGLGSSVFLSKCEVKGTSVVFCLPSMDAFFYCHIIATGASTLWWCSNILARLGAGLSLWSSLKVLNEEICVKGQGNVSTWYYSGVLPGFYWAITPQMMTCVWVRKHVRFLKMVAVRPAAACAFTTAIAHFHSRLMSHLMSICL